MPASLKFESATGRPTTELDKVKIITLTGENSTHTHEYTLDITGDDIKLKYRKLAVSDGDVVANKSYSVTDLAKALESLLTAESSTDGKSVLAKEVAEQAVVDVLVPALATVGTDNTKKVYTQKAVDDALNLKADASALRDLVLEKGPSAQAVATQLLSTAKTKDDLGKAIIGVTKEVDGTHTNSHCCGVK